jgi:hypothetical protein
LAPEGEPERVVSSPYMMDFEEGTTHGWTSKLGENDPPILVIDTSSPGRPAVQRIQRSDGGPYRSPLIQVVGGQLYCVRGWIRWVGGGWPAVRVQRYGYSNTLGANWVIGRPGYSDGLGGTVTPVKPDSQGWRWYAKEIELPHSTVAVRLESQVIGGESKAGEAVSYFDELGLTEGPCPRAPNAASPY